MIINSAAGKAVEEKPAIEPVKQSTATRYKAPDKTEENARIDLVEAEIMTSLLDNGISVHASKKLMKLLTTESLKYVFINYEK